MIEIMKCACAVLLLILIFDVWGSTLADIMKWNVSKIETVLYGFFLFFAVFQIVYLPLVFTKQSFHMLTVGWTIIVVIVTVSCSIYLIHEKVAIVSFKKEYLNPVNYAWAYIACALLGAGVVISVLQRFYGWDTAYYVGCMNEAIYTNSIGLYNGNTGIMEKEIPIRYALSGFYMQFAVVSKLLNVKPVITAYYLMRGLCVILSEGVVFCIAKELFQNRIKPALAMTCMWLIINYMWYTDHATPLFLIRRSYEAKGYCANVVLPAILYCLVMLHREKENSKVRWQILFLCCMACVAVSMSSLLIVPIMILISVFVMLIFDRKKEYIFYSVLCMVPNILYATVFLLNKFDLFRISTR